MREEIDMEFIDELNKTINQDTDGKLGVQYGYISYDVQAHRDKGGGFTITFSPLTITVIICHFANVQGSRDEYGRYPTFVETVHEEEIEVATDFIIQNEVESSVLSTIKYAIDEIEWEVEYDSPIKVSATVVLNEV